MKFHVLIASFLLTNLVIGLADAQTNRGESERPKAYLSILALGEVAESRYRKTTAAEKARIRKLSEEMRKGGGAKMKGFELEAEGVTLPPAEEAIPPRALTYSTKEQKDLKPFQLRRNRILVGFNTIMPPKEIPFGKKLKLAKLGQSAEYLTLPKIEKPGQFLMILLPGDDGKLPWKSARKGKILEISAGGLAKGSAYVVNYSSDVVFFRFGDTKTAAPKALKPGQSVVIKVNEETKASNFIGYSRNKKVVCRRRIRPSENSLDIFAFHNANPATSRGRKIGVAEGTLPRLKIQPLPTP